MCPRISLFLSFSCRTWNFPPLASFFLYRQFPKAVSLFLCLLFSLKWCLSRLPPRFMCPSRSFPHCQYRDLPRLYRVLYFRLTFFPAMVSNPFLTSFSLSSFLLYAVFPGLVPKVWHTALLGFGINFFSLTGDLKILEFSIFWLY